MNLLTETKTAITTSGHKISDIRFIGSLKTGHSCTWKEFEILADVTYDHGFGAAEVAQDLVIVFKDGQKMWRDEYDGSEWWEFSTPSKIPRKKLPIRRLIVRHDQIGWKDLAEINQ
jgi:hypothetical protein